MTTNKYVVHSKFTETNLVQRNSEYHGEKKKKKEIKKMKCSKRRNFKTSNMSMEGNDTHRNKLVKNIQS